jgi:hypothetical protein
MFRTQNAVWPTLLVVLLGCSERAQAADSRALLAVNNLLGLFSQYSDEADRDGYRSVFTADPHIEIDGAMPAIEQHIEQRIARSTRFRQAGQQPRRLFASPVMSAVSADEVRVRGYFTDLLGQRAGGQGPQMLAVGRFQATVLRVGDEGWRIHDWREWSDQMTEAALPMAEPEAAEAIEPAEIPIDGRHWRLQELFGEPLSEGLPVPTLVLDGAAARAFGFAGVHAFGGRIRLAEETLRFVAIVAPGAEEPAEAAALQETYLDMLGQVRAWQFDEPAARLVLLGQDSEPLALYSAAD